MKALEMEGKEMHVHIRTRTHAGTHARKHARTRFVATLLTRRNSACKPWASILELMNFCSESAASVRALSSCAFNPATSSRSAFGGVATPKKKDARRTHASERQTPKQTPTRHHRNALQGSRCQK